MGWLHDMQHEIADQIEVNACDVGMGLANELKGDDEYQTNGAVHKAAKERAAEYAKERANYEKMYGCRGPLCTCVSRFVSGWYSVRNMQRAQLGYAGMNPLLAMGSGRMGMPRGYEFGD